MSNQAARKTREFLRITAAPVQRAGAFRSQREGRARTKPIGALLPTRHPRCPQPALPNPAGAKRIQEEPRGISQLAAHPGPRCALQHADPEMFPSLPGGRSPPAPLLEATILIMKPFDPSSCPGQPAPFSPAQPGGLAGLGSGVIHGQARAAEHRSVGVVSYL